MPTLAEIPNMDIINDWPLAVILKESKPRAAPQATNASDMFYYSSLSTICHEFLLLGKTRCAICHGYGHSHKHCPTNGRLRHYTRAGVSSTILKRAKDAAKEKNSFLSKGKLQHYSFLPNAGPKKRKRPQFEAEKYPESLSQPPLSQRTGRSGADF